MLSTAKKAHSKQPANNGHESVLNAFKVRKSLVQLRFPDGTKICGNIVAFDRYTISLRYKVNDKEVTEIFFKSALIGFSLAN